MNPKQPPAKIIGQESLIKDLSKIITIFKSSGCLIRPHFFLTGESGSGKSITIKTLAQIHDVGYFEINAAQLTKEGVSGNSLSKALTPMLQLSAKPVIIFVDEFDKLFISGNSNDSSAHESTTGVQNEFLKVLESDTASVFGDYGKYITTNMSRTLFIFAGAFNNEPNISIDRLRELGLKTEFLGRVGLIYSTASLSIDSLYEILDNSPLLENYLKLFSNADREKVVLEIKAHIRDNHTYNTIGARFVNTLIHQYFIKGGLNTQEVKEIAFQHKLTL